MKIVRIVQLIVLVLLVAYVVLVHILDSSAIKLPFLMALPIAIVVTFALLVGGLLGALPEIIASAQQKRELKELKQRLFELEQHIPAYERGSRGQSPIIPDRTPTLSDAKTNNA